MAIAFAREGADILISYLPVEQEDAEQTRHWVEETGRRCVPLSRAIDRDLRDALCQSPRPECIGHLNA